MIKNTSKIIKKNGLEVKKSDIHGRGVFATRNFAVGEIVIEHDISQNITQNEYENLKENEKKYVSVIDGKYIKMQKPGKYVNHSCDANVETKNGCDIAIRNIKKGDEIFADYTKEIPMGEWRLCNCGAKNCKKTIKNIQI